ncbi:carboxypeptidase regulatory-like domain-containing protein [bacterium]|nr:carboxypeptidase regulatory-like domain-containing protein [bacterium]
MIRRSLILCLLAALVLSGCSSVPTSSTPTSAVVVVEAVDTSTDENITVEATAIVGGVRGTVTVEEQSVVLRGVPFGTGSPPTQPVTVTAPGYATITEWIQLSMTVVTFYTAQLDPVDTTETGTVRGTVTSSTGAPITSALVKFTHVATGGTTQLSGYTDSSGQYVIGGIPIGVSTVTAEADGFVTSGSVETTVVQDAGGGVSPDVNLSLIPGTATVDVSGVVVNTFTDARIPGALVHFGDVADVTTDSTGSFTVSAVPVGTHEVTVTADGYDDYETSVSVLPGMARLRFTMSPAAPDPPTSPYNLMGTVTLVGAEDNSGAVVTAVDTASGTTWATVTTPASGVYTMFLTPGEYRITATYGAKSVRRTVTVPYGGRILTGVDFVITVG